MEHDTNQFETYWQWIIYDIRTLSKQVGGYPYSYESIGGKVGVSRSAVWRMTLPSINYEHLAEPKFSVGMNLLELHAKLVELSKEVE